VTGTVINVAAILAGSAGESSSRVSEAFFDASLLFCVGPLAVVGAIQDGLTGNYEALATKALLDGFASIALAATLGWGVALSALSVLVYQGALSLGAPRRDRREGREPPAGTRVRTRLGGDRLAVLESAHAGGPRSHVA
jgi:uncharacterized membrane protein YqgA involved in biofilm formation